VIEDYLVREVTKLGGIAYKFQSPRRRSVPDRIVALPGRLFFVEVKATGERPTLAQLREHTRLQMLGLTVYVCDSLSSVDVILQVQMGEI
jgi:hypothetical protein